MGVHPHPFRVRLPLPARAFTSFSQDGHRPVTDLRRRPARVAGSATRRKGSMTMRFKPVSAAMLAVLALGVAACGASNEEDSPPAAAGNGAPAATAEALSGNLTGAGSSAQEAAQAAWIAGFQDANPDATIAYDPVGSGGGREQFIAGGTQYGGTDSHFKEEELTKAQARCGGPDNLVEIPVYISPIAMIYNLEGVDNLQLSPETLAKIFKQEIKTWD